MALFATRAVAITSAVVISIPAVVILFRAMRRQRKHTAISSFANMPTSQWSTEHVAQWLRSLGVSAAAVSSFEKNEVDGSVIFLLEEEHVGKLATKLRDRLVILKGLSSLREKEEARCTVSSCEQPTFSEPQADALGERGVTEFLEEANLIRSLLVSDRLNAASPALQREILQECVERFRGALVVFQSFSPETQTTFLPLVKEISVLISQQQQNGALKLPQGIDQLEAQLRPLHEMLDGFLEALDLANIGGAMNPSIVLLRDKIVSQIHHVMRIAGSLPPEHGEPLRNKCDLIMKRIQGSTTATKSTATTAAPDVLEGGASMLSEQKSAMMASVVKRLRDVFDFLKSPELLHMNPKERLTHLSNMLRDVRSIRDNARSWNDARAFQIVNDVAMNVILALEEMESITNTEIGYDPTTAEKEDGNDLSAPMDLSRILASLKAVVQVLHSDELLRAPREVQKRMQFRLKQSLQRLRGQVASLPSSQNTASMVSMIDKIEGLVDTFIDEHSDNIGEAAESLRKLQQQEEKGGYGQGREGEHQGRRLGGPHADEMEEILQKDMIEKATGEIEELFEYLKSDEFVMLTPKIKKVISQKRLYDLNAIAKRCVHLEGSEQLRESINIIKKMLLAEMNGEADEKEKGSSTQAHSALYVDMLFQLNQIKELINSVDFQSTDMDKKRELSRIIISQLQKIMTLLPQLSQQERAMINEVIIPIREWLQSISAGGDEDFSSVSGDRERIVGQLEEILGVLQSEEFCLAPLEKRHLIAKRFLQVLQGLADRCDELGESAILLLPILRRLQSQLKDFVQVNEVPNLLNTLAGGDVETAVSTTMSRANENKNCYNDKDACVNDKRNVPVLVEAKEQQDELSSERQKLFATVMEITTELSANSVRNIFLSKEEVQSLRGLLEMVDSIGFFSPHEKQLRDEFEAQIVRLTAAENSCAIQETPGSGVPELMHIFAALKTQLQTEQRSLLPAELMSIMKLVESSLNTADEQSVPWRNHLPAVDLIAGLLSQIHKAQEGLCEDSTAEVGGILSEGLQELRRSPPQNKEQLQKFIDILSRMSNKTADMSIGELEMFKDYQEAVLEVTDALDANQEMESERCETYVARLLLGMSDQLKDCQFTNDILDRYSALLERIELSLKDHAGLEAVRSVREQIKLQRALNSEGSRGEEEEGEENYEEERNEEEEEFVDEEEEKEGSNEEQMVEN